MLDSFFTLNLHHFYFYKYQMTKVFNNTNEIELQYEESDW